MLRESLRYLCRGHGSFRMSWEQHEQKAAIDRKQKKKRKKTEEGKEKRKPKNAIPQ